MKKQIKRIAALRAQVSDIWDKREGVITEGKRAFREGPAEFKKSEGQSKLTIVLIVLMIGGIIGLLIT